MLSAMQYPHWLLVAGAVLVVVGFIGLAFRKNNAEPAENNLTQEAAAHDEPNPPWLDRRRSAGGEREMSEPNKLDPTPGLPDDTPISDVELPARIRNALVAAGIETVGEVRETADETLLSFQNLGKSSVAHIRETLGSVSTDGVRPSEKKPA
jgi:DNA-directed RNA polymerase alpha subunit